VVRLEDCGIPLSFAYTVTTWLLFYNTVWHVFRRLWIDSYVELRDRERDVEWLTLAKGILRVL
jgi:hypothetical protein